MIGISAASLVAVFLIIFCVIALVSIRQLNTTMDMLTDRISEGNGVFLPFDRENPRPPDMDRFPGFFTEETPFSTRFFAVWMNAQGRVVGENIKSISSVPKEAAHEYAAAAIQRGQERGWQGNYRYKVVETRQGTTVVFVEGSVNRSVTRTLLATAAAVLAGSMVVILLLIVQVSKKAVRPIAQSYEKQKQFVTDANHELKTPLTLILTNLEILESEIGENEWLEDIRAEGQRMSALVNELTALSRLDEEEPQEIHTECSLDEIVGDTVAEFDPLAESRGLRLRAEILSPVTIMGEEGQLRRVAAILLDNAVKYCDPAGEITVTLSDNKGAVLCVENTFREVDGLELSRLFDRFYRADKARTSSGSFGIGLSLAREIVQRHRGEIRVYKAGEERIGFRVTLK